MESWLIKITNYLLAQSWQIAILVIVIGLISFILRNKSAHIRYLLWLIVLAKCMVPPLYTIPVAVLPQQEEVLYTPAPPISESIAIAEDTMPEAGVTESAGSVFVEPEKMSTPMVSDKSISFDTLEWLAIGWIVGIVVFSLYYLINALRTQIWLHKRRKALPSEYRNNIESLFITHGVRKIPRIWLLDRINQPFVWGLIRGSIYMPAKLLNKRHEKFRTSLLGHELSHVIHFDALINSLQVISQAIFWFHPFVWWTNRKIRAEREKCCDEMTIARLNALPEEYSEAIVEILAAKYKQARPVPSLAVAGPVKNVEERIRTMLRPGKKFYRRPSVIAIVVLLLVAVFTIPIGCALTRRTSAETAIELDEQPAKTLHEAATDGDIKLVKLLISEDADVNARDRIGDTPLHRAASEGYPDIVKLLIDLGADVNASNTTQVTPLHRAASSGNLEIVEILISNGADINAENRPGMTPLYLAASEGNTDIVKLLIDYGADINLTTNAQRTPLHTAAVYGNNETIELLLSEDADINAKDSRSVTPLCVAMTSLRPGRKEVVDFLITKDPDVSDFHLAAYMGDLEKLKELLQDGISINSQEDVGSTALHLAANAGNKDIVEFLISEGATIDVKDIYDWTPLIYAASQNYEDIVDLLLENGADVNAKDESGYTLLYHAILADKEDKKGPVELLIDKGANVNVQGEEDGFTPLIYAILMDDKDLVELLINKGADVNAKDKIGGYTPIYWATFMDNNEIIELLTTKGATITSTIHIAAFKGDLASVKQFIDQGTDIDAKDEAGLTALHWAIMQGYKDIAEFLITNDADNNIKNQEGQTPLHLATRQGRIDIVEILLTNGADVNSKNKWYRTPMDIALDEGHKEIIELLREDGAVETLLDAAAAGDIEKVRTLIAQHAYVNLRDDIDQTPLHKASQRGHKDVAELLISAGADINASTPQRWDATPLHCAVGNSRKEMVELLLAKGAIMELKNLHGQTPLHLAADENRLEIAELLLSKGADIEARTNYYQTPLHRAVGRGHIDMVNLLLARGANLKATRLGISPIGCAMRAQQKEMVEFLAAQGAESSPIHIAAYFGELEELEDYLKNGTDIDDRDPSGFIPLHCAICGGQEQVVKSLLAKGTDVNAQDACGWTALHYASQMGHKQMVELLLEHGANVNIREIVGRNPLYLAAYEGHKDIVQLLQTKGADINVKHVDNFTPLHVAARNGHKDVVEFLLDQEATVNLKTSDGSTPLSLAKGNGHTEIVELLREHGAEE